MPIYAFQCADCGHAFDRLQKLSDPDPAACPSCGAPSVKRQLTAPSFRLSGSGWYETDFKKDGDRKRNLTDSGDGGGKTEAKTEARPDTGEAKPAAPAKDAAAAKPDAKTDKPASSPEPKPKPAAPGTPAG